MTRDEAVKMKRYFNYATDHQPRHTYNIGDVSNLYTSERAAVRACKAWCRSEGLVYDDDMVDEVTDVVEKEDGGRTTNG